MTPHRTTVLARRNLIPLALACSCAVSALGCASRRDQVQRHSSSVTVASTGDEEYGMNPDYDLDEKFLVFLPLFTEREDGELEGRLARSWDQSPDRREWTFHLRTDVRWEDGVPVTARDVEFGLALLADPRVGLFTRGTYAVAVDNDSTVRIRSLTLTAIRDLKSIVIFPKHLLEGLNEKDIYTWDFWLHPVGDGPYRLHRRVPATLVEFEASPSYYGTKPRIERVIVRSVGDVRFAELLSGGVDVLYGPSPAQSLLLATDPRFPMYHGGGGWGIWGIFWNVRLPFFRDPRVRRALILAIDRQEARQVLALPPDLPVVDGPHTPRQLHRGDLRAPLPYDTAQARALLEAAGWFDTDGDGVRERDGRPFHFVATVAPDNRRLAAGTLAVYIQEQLRRVGVRMEIQAVQTSGSASGPFDAFIAGSRGMSWWVRTFGDSSGTGYHNPRVAQLLGLFPLATDPEEEDRILREVTWIFQTDAPATFFFPQMELVVANRRIRGLSSPWRADPLEHMDKLWLEDGH